MNNFWEIQIEKTYFRCQSLFLLGTTRIEKKLTGHYCHNINYFKSIKHPKGTSEFYYNAYFGNSSGTSNHCEHVITQFRKYKIGGEKEIKEYYELNYRDVTLQFYRKLEDCDGDSEFGYTAYTSPLLPNKPKFKLENANSTLPFYVIEYWEDASNTLDWECY